MMFQLIVNKEAQDEFEEAAIWYEQQQAGLGEKFIDCIYAKLEIINKYPERYPRRKGSFREAPVKIFPYNIVYTFYKKDKIITVSCIFHTSRNPFLKFRKNR